MTKKTGSVTGRAAKAAVNEGVADAAQDDEQRFDAQYHRPVDFALSSGRSLFAMTGFLDKIGLVAFNHYVKMGMLKVSASYQSEVHLGTSYLVEIPYEVLKDYDRWAQNKKDGEGWRDHGITSCAWTEHYRNGKYVKKQLLVFSLPVDGAFADMCEDDKVSGRGFPCEVFGDGSFATTLVVFREEIARERVRLNKELVLLYRVRTMCAKHEAKAKLIPYADVRRIADEMKEQVGRIRDRPVVAYANGMKEFRPLVVFTKEGARNLKAMEKDGKKGDK